MNPIPGPALLAATLLAVTSPAQEIDYARHWEAASRFEAFLAGVEKRGDEWRASYAAAESVSPELLGRVLAAGGRWRLLVIAEDWCGDSLHTVPWMARLAELAPNLELAVAGGNVGRDVMEAHRTPDGRAATPTAVLLDEAFAERGCWVERPEVLQSWYLEREGRIPREELQARKYQWYAGDRGGETLREIVERIEAAAAGRVICASPSGAR
jgi:hypothetical protein